MKFLFIIVLIGSLPAFGAQIFAETLSCTYTRKSGGHDFSDRIDVVKNEPVIEKMYRMFGFKISIEKNNFKVEFREAEKKKIINQSVKDIWTIKRNPSQIEVMTKINDHKLSLICF